MQAVWTYKCVFDRNLYDTYETNSILEIRLALCCPISDDINSSFLNVTDFLNLRVVTLLILMQVSFCIFCIVQIQEQKFYDAHCKIVH